MSETHSGRGFHQRVAVLDDIGGKYLAQHSVRSGTKVSETHIVECVCLVCEQHFAIAFFAPPLRLMTLFCPHCGELADYGVQSNRPTPTNSLREMFEHAARRRNGEE